METELGRLSTYNEWPDESSMFPSKLAEAGFCHTGKVDEVECRVCRLKIREWHKGDDPLARHLTESLDCELARSIKQNIDMPSLLQNVPTNDTDLLQHTGNDESVQLNQLIRQLSEEPPNNVAASLHDIFRVPSHISVALQDNAVMDPDEVRHRRSLRRAARRRQSRSSALRFSQNPRFNTPYHTRHHHYNNLA